jgi:hypothetical protein
MTSHHRQWLWLLALLILLVGEFTAAGWFLERVAP